MCTGLTSIAAVLILTAVTVATASAQTPGHIMVTPQEMKWSDVPSLPGAQISVLEGPLNQAGPLRFA